MERSRDTNKYPGEGCSPDASFSKILEDNGVSRWKELLWSKGVRGISDLRRVKYADLVAYGVADFSCRKKIFELIKKLNREDSGTLLFSPARNRPLSAFESAAWFEADVDREKLVHRDSFSVDGEERLSVFREGYSPRSAAWKRRREMMGEILEEAEHSVIEESERSLLDGASEHLAENSAEVLEEDPTNGIHFDLPNETLNTTPNCTHNSTLDEIHNEDLDEAETPGRIVVVVRKRPARQNGVEDVVSVGKQLVILTENKQKIDLTPYKEPHRFMFDRAFNEFQGTEEVYLACVRDLVLHATDGGGSTCIAYGQTGSGKTHTMLDPSLGVIVQAIKDLLSRPITVSFYEIYGNHIYDLLDERKRIYAREKEGIVSIIGISEHRVRTLQEAMRWVNTGLQTRTTGRTGANTNSSRSHALFRVKTDGGIFTFVDLAGSERGSERAEEGQPSTVKREGADINRSLLALKECIRALDRSAAHLPFRHSKLTQVLKESLVGNSRCCLIATVSPEASSAEHTLNTLRYAYRIREIGRRTGEKEAVLAERSARPSDSASRNTEPAARNSRPSNSAVRDPRPSNSAARDPRPSNPAVGDVGRSEPVHAKGVATAQQALAMVASRIAREKDVRVLEWLGSGLQNLARGGPRTDK